MATEAADRSTSGADGHWRLGFGGYLLIGLADFCAAVGIGNLMLDQAAAVWLFVAGALFLAGIASGG